MIHDRTRASQRPQMLAMLACLLTANVLSWVWAWRVFHDQKLLMGTALLAWLFGLRHAVDADHIAAIDNVVRKLVQSGYRAWDGGLFFALGHSAIVLIACAAAAVFPAAGWAAPFRDAAAFWGTIVSATFLFLIALTNSVTLRRLWRVRGDTGGEIALTGGLLTRVLKPVQLLVTRSWHMLFVGFLFALGFDTASEVMLLALTGQQAAAGLPLSSVLVFPALFTAGMVLVDAADSAAMTGAYHWAFDNPARKAGYNIVVTSLSVFAALSIGGLEVLGLFVDAGGRVAALLMNVLPYAGFGLAGMLLSIWGFAGFARRTRTGLPVRSGGL